MFDYLKTTPSESREFSLFFKWATLNLLAFVLLLGAYYLGLLIPVFLADSTGIVYLISALVLFAIASSGTLSIKIQNNKSSEEEIRFLQVLGSTAVMLGLIGTVIGIIIALQAVQVEAVGDATKVGIMVAGLAKGMGIALYTTLVGGIASLYIGFNHFLLSREIRKINSESDA